LGKIPPFSQVFKELRFSQVCLGKFGKGKSKRTRLRGDLREKRVFPREKFIIKRLWCTKVGGVAATFGG